MDQQKKLLARRRAHATGSMIALYKLAKDSYIIHCETHDTKRAGPSRIALTAAIGHPDGFCRQCKFARNERLRRRQALENENLIHWPFGEKVGEKKK